MHTLTNRWLSSQGIAMRLNFTIEKEGFGIRNKKLENVQ